MMNMHVLLTVTSLNINAGVVSTSIKNLKSLLVHWGYASRLDVSSLSAHQVPAPPARVDGTKRNYLHKITDYIRPLAAATAAIAGVAFRRHNCTMIPAGRLFAHINILNLRVQI